jgi:tetratricopeptide (TPR) repeat protein
MADFIQEMRGRRVLPAVGFYVGSCWVLIEILDRLVERYLLSPYFTDIAFWGLYSLIPAVILIAWTHGKPGKDKSTILEKVGVPINVIATIGLLITAFGDKDLSAAANLITVNNEQGVQEAHYIPNESFRRRMVVFFFRNKSDDPELDWLQYGITELLVQNLTQNPFISASSPWENLGNGFYARMKQAGFKDGLGVPRSLMQEIADDSNRQYFVEGDVNLIADEYQVTVRVWETKSLKQTGSFTESGWDLYTTIDKITVRIRDELEIPKNNDRIAKSLPLSETYGESSQAFRDYIGALNARLFDNDLDASNALLESSLAADPDFVRSWFLKVFNGFDAGDLPAAQAAIKRTQELDYKLPILDKATVKQVNYRLTGQQEKLISFLRMQVRLRDDAGSHNTLAVMLAATGELEEAKQEYLMALSRDPLNLGIYLQLATLEKGIGDMDAAISYVRDYLNEKPGDASAQQRMGDLLRDSGDLDGAEAHYLQASLLENVPVQPTLKLVLIALRKGDENSARALLEDAENMAETPLNKAQVRATAAYTEYRLGRVGAAIEQLYRQEQYLREILPPFQVAQYVYSAIIRYYVDLGEPEKARQELAKILTELQPPLDQFLAFSEAAILIHDGDLEAAEAAVARGVEIIDQFKLEELKFQMELVEGYIKYKRNDYAGSAVSFLAARERISHSVLVGSDADLLLPPLNASLARSLIFSGNLEGAQKALDIGFEQDPSEPTLWLSKARFQLESGMPHLALASVNYALAIWKDADPEYREFKLAKALAEEIREVL